MTQIDIHPAVARQEDLAMLDYIKNRNLMLAQLASAQSSVMDQMRAEIDELSTRVTFLAAELEALKPKDDEPDAAAENPTDDPSGTPGGAAADLVEA